METALLLIDIQNDYFPGGKMEVPGSAAAALRAGKILHFFREQGMPIIHVRHISIRPGAAFFLPQTEGAEIHESVRPISPETVIEKNYPNSFRDTPLLSLLQKGGIKRLVVAGMMTQMCVDATVRAAFDLGFSSTVIHDGCAARPLSFGGEDISAHQAHAAFLAALNGIYARLVSAAEFLEGN